MAFAGTHAYLTDGHTGTWLAALDRLAGELAGVRLYPGHGPAGGVELFDDQRKYLLMYREAVARLAAGDTSLDEERKRELTSLMVRYAPDAPLDWLVSLGADPVAAELAA
ncbi:hypothetical protein [Nonomuraea sp. NPDC049028]|uniref:hypothetical protein n=1 Tax=Nonomuraea sp. NPDC049028 TaxID=3364348 RepID=UPI00372409AB